MHLLLISFVLILTCISAETKELIHMDVRKTEQHTKYQWAKYKGTSNLCYQPVDGGGQMKTYLP